MSQTTSPPTASQVIDQTQQTASQVVDQAQEKVGQVVDQAKQQTTSLLAARKDQATDTLYTVAHALRQTGQQLRAQEQAPVAGLADQVATRVESVSGYLQGRDVRQLVGDTEDFARQRPAVFVGGALALGVLAARFLKSSRRRATTPAGQTIPAERALVEATPSMPMDQAYGGVAPETGATGVTDQVAYGASVPMDQAADEVTDTEGATELYRLTSFQPPPRPDANLERGYLLGRYGARPRVSPGELAREVDVALAR